MKKFFLKTIIALVFVVVLDGLFLLFRDINDCPDSVLSALVGLNIAYVSLFLVPICTPKQRGTQVLRDTLYLVGTIYFIFEFIVGVTFLFWEQETMVLPVSIQAALFGIYIIVLFSNVLANDATQKSINKQNAESANIKLLVEEAELTRQLVKSDKNAYKLLTSLYDELRTSPIRSNPDVADIEKEMLTSLMQMRDYANAGDISEVIQTATQVRQLITKRNFKLKNILHY